MGTKKRKFISKLKNKYRLVLINDNSLADVFSIRLTPMNVLMLLSSIFTLFAILVFFLIAYTPIRQWVPGYGKTGDNEAWLELNQRIEDLKRKHEGRTLKEDALNKILNEREHELDTTGNSTQKK